MSPGRESGSSRSRVDLLGLSRFSFARSAGLKPWLDAVLAEVAPDSGTLAVRFVGDRSMRRLNREFRSRDTTTDVLSFPGGTTPEGPYLGDVVISVPRAMEQAGERGHDLARELQLLLIHGILHCLGHDHETDDGTMQRLERRLRLRHLDDA